MTIVQGGNTLTLKGSLYPVSLSFTRYQLHGVSADGLEVYVRDDAQYEDIYWKILLHEPHSNIDDIRGFVINYLKFSKNTCTFTPDSNIDLGSGAGSAVTARYWDSNFVDQMHAWKVYKPEMIFRKEKT